jgi:hypothetical protein
MADVTSAAGSVAASEAGAMDTAVLAAGDSAASADAATAEPESTAVVDFTSPTPRERDAGVWHFCVACVVLLRVLLHVW